MERLRFGMVGGGIGSYIGSTHKIAATLDDKAELVAGCFSRSPEKNRKSAEAWHLPDMSRVYDNYEEMAAREGERADGIRFVSIVTPNASHYPAAKAFMEHGIHVMCDKPLAMTVEQAEELVRIAEERDLLFGVSYGYTGYPVIRQAREMIENGMIGEIAHVRVSHPEDYMMETEIPEDPEDYPWRFRPEFVGEALCTADLGSHAHMLMHQFTGLNVKRVLAMIDRFPRNVPMETNTTALLDLGDGITGELWASQIALGKSCSPHILVIGSKGSLEWDHEKPDLLRYRKVNGCIEILESGKDYMCEASRNLNFVSPGHHEGFYEAFGSVYRSFIECLNAKIQNRDPGTYRFPTVRDGADGMRFIAACMKSVRNGNTWTEV